MYVCMYICMYVKDHQNCIRRILNIEWRSYTPDTVVLERTCSTSIEKRLVLNQMHWTGYVVGMGDGNSQNSSFMLS